MYCGFTILVFHVLPCKIRLIVSQTWYKEKPIVDHVAVPPLEWAFINI